MASLYLKQGKFWARYKDETGRWGNMPTPYRPGQEGEARKFLRHLKNKCDAMRETKKQAGVMPSGPLTVSAYAKVWFDARQRLGNASHSDDVARITLHVIPRIGSLLLEEVRPRHIRELVTDLRAGAKLAPRTIRHIFATTQLMFKYAVADEVLITNPCVITRGILPKKEDKNPDWRAGAIFSRDEVERLISDVRIPEDRRVLYALKSLAGMRHSEAAGLHWRNYDTCQEPLHALSLGKTKTKVPRRVPVHATLARMLAAWKLAGFERTYGRPPTADDLIVPTRRMTERQSPESQAAFLLDLGQLKLRIENGEDNNRRGHDLRRTFITLAQVDGARRDILETVSHGPRGDIMNVYTTLPWPTVCEEVAKLKISLREGLVLDGDFEGLATRLATTQRTARNRWVKSATPAGFEPAFKP